jgi:hypothetical protein
VCVFPVSVHLPLSLTLLSQSRLPTHTLFRVLQLDCGVHPAYPGIGGLPFFDEMPVDPSDIDLLLVSQ